MLRTLNNFKLQLTLKEVFIIYYYSHAINRLEMISNIDSYFLKLRRKTSRPGDALRMFVYKINVLSIKLFGPTTDRHFTSSDNTVTEYPDCYIDGSTEYAFGKGTSLNKGEMYVCIHVSFFTQTTDWE